MSLREVIRGEITSKEAIKVTFEDVEAISREIIEGYWWCLTRLDEEVCSKYDKLIYGIITSLGKIRVSKGLETGVPKGSFDEKFISKLLELIDTYYKVHLLGIIDSEGNVPVRIIKDFRLGDREFRRDSITLLNVVDAVLLKSLGLVEVIGKML